MVIKKFYLIMVFFLTLILAGCLDAGCEVPTVSMVSPSNSSNNVPINPVIKLQFSSAVINVNSPNVTLHESSESGTTIAIGAITAGESNTYSFSPLPLLNSYTTYYVVVDSGVTDSVGNAVVTTSFNFTTGDYQSPTVSILAPSNNASNISTSPNIQLQFSESVINVNVTTVTLHTGSATGALVGVGSFTAGADNTYTFSPSTPLNEQTIYYVVVSDGITDIAGNHLIPNEFNFTTGDFTAPTVSIISPSNNANDVSADTSIQLQFSESVNNVNATTVTLHTASATGAVVGVGSFIAGINNTYTFSPSSQLQSGVTYYVVVSDGVTDLAGNALIPSQFNFTVVAQPLSVLSPSNAVNLTPMTFTNHSGSNLTIDSIVTNNSNVIVTPNGNSCTGYSVNDGVSCGFTLSPNGFTVLTPVTITFNFNGGTSQSFVVNVNNTYLANCSINGGRYILVRYMWGSGDFDIAAGFSSITPSASGFPIFDLNSFSFGSGTNCVGYSCGLGAPVSYNSNMLFKWAGDNTFGGQEDVLVDTWSVPNGTTNFNYALLGNWYGSIPTSSTAAVVFEVYATGTNFALDTSTYTFIPDQQYLNTCSSSANVTWDNPQVDPLSSGVAGLSCTYDAPTVGGQANNGNCQFIGKQ